jgi:hypothetical protein
VLVEQVDPDGLAERLVEGRAAHQAPEVDGSCTVLLPAGQTVSVGDVVQARVTATAGVDLEAEFVCVIDAAVTSSAVVGSAVADAGLAVGA